MRTILSALLLGLTAFSVGCGPAEEADTSHLDVENNPEAKAAAEEAREQMQTQQGAGQHGAGGPRGSGHGGPPGSGQ